MKKLNKVLRVLVLVSVFVFGAAPSVSQIRGLDLEVQTNQDGNDNCYGYIGLCPP